MALTALEHGAFVASSLLVYVMTTRIRRQRRPPSAAIAWVLSIALLPYLGLPLFLLLGSRKVVRPGHRPAHRPPHPGDTAGLPPPPWPRDLLDSLGAQAPCANARVQWLTQGEPALAALLELCRSARQTLDVQTFILGDDDTGHAVANALADAARRGVHTRLLLDGAGSLGWPRHRTRQLEAAGVQVCRFMPLWRHVLQGRANLRNHRKLAIADGTRLWFGGRNLADEYFVDRPGQPAWLDLSVVVDGPLARQALDEEESQHCGDDQEGAQRQDALHPRTHRSAKGMVDTTPSMRGQISREDTDPAMPARKGRRGIILRLLEGLAVRPWDGAVQ